METKQEWLKARSKGIGGSEITAVMGLDPYKTPYQLWEQKTGRISSFEGNKFTKAGNYLEPVIAQMFQDETGLEVYVPKTEHWTHPDYPHLLGTPDRFVSQKHGEAVLEIKSTMKRITREDVLEGQAINWYFQVMWYMGITGLKSGFIAWLVNGVDFDFIEVEFNREIFTDMVEAGNDFWMNNVVADTPPAPINSDDIKKIIGMVLPDAIEATEEALRIHHQIIENKQKISSLEDANEELKTAIQLLMMDHSHLTYQGATLFTWKESTPLRLDGKELKEQQPEIWNRYAKKGNVRTFLVK
jgi:putative phage-type endonuclease